MVSSFCIKRFVFLCGSFVVVFFKALWVMSHCSAFRVYFRVLFSLVLSLLCCSKQHQHQRRRRRTTKKTTVLSAFCRHKERASSSKLFDDCAFLSRAKPFAVARVFIREREREKNDAFGVWKEIGDEIKTAGSFLTSWRLRHHRRRRRRSRSEKARSRDERWSPTHPRGG